MKEEKNRIHLKLDDTLINLLQDYHDISPAEAITFFHGMAKDMMENEGNVVNSTKYSEKLFTRANGTTAWKSKAQNSPIPFTETFDAYALRGFYPNSKIPFKLSGVKANFGCCFVASIGNKNKNQSVHPEGLDKLEEIVSESILLDVDPSDIEQTIYKTKTFRCMRPKGMPLLKKSK